MAADEQRHHDSLSRRPAPSREAEVMLPLFVTNGFEDALSE
jgi:hypothetical protein